jgi:non-specific serine/threonine protein kinase
MSERITDPKQKRILEALQGIPAGSVYHLAPKEYVERGFAYYRQHRVQSFEWGAGFSRLTARVKGTRLYAVSFSLHNGGLASSCTCPAWMERSTCKHVVCAVVTIKNLIQPEVFRLPGDDGLGRRPLLRDLYTRRALLEKRVELPTGYSIVLEKNGSLLDLSVQHNGERVVAFFHTVPAPLRPLVVARSSYPRADALIPYLLKYGNRFPLVFQDGDEAIVTEFDDDRRYAARTEINVLDGSSVTATRRCAVDGERLQNDIELFDEVVVDRKDRKLGLVRDVEGWQPWLVLRHAIDAGARAGADRKNVTVSGTAITVPVNFFQRLQFTYPLSSRAALRKVMDLKVDGVRSKAKVVEPSYRLSIMADDRREGLFRLVPECRPNGLLMAPSYRLFGFLGRLSSGLPAAFRARKRMDVICRAFFDLVAGPSKTAALKIIRTAAAEAGFTVYARRRELRELLADLYEAARSEEELVTFFGGSWMAVPVDAQRQAFLYRVPFELFGADIFRNVPAYDAMGTPALRLYERLPELRSLLAEHGIDLYFKGKPVALSRWEITVDATAGADIDWFELRPEIRCDGRVMDPSFLATGRNGKALIEDGEGIRIIDANTREVLDRIAAIVATAGDGARQGREVVRVPRLRILDWLALRKRGVLVKLPPADEAVLSRLVNFTAVERRPLPGKLAAKLRPYQRDGYDWLTFLYEHRFGACLADDMGLGKTLQAISLLAGLREGTVRARAGADGRPHLIVVPPSLLFNWEQEIRRFYPGIRVLMYSGLERTAAFDGCDAVITTYGTVRRDIETLKDIPFHVIIFDEAQAVKNVHADQTAAVRRLTGAFKLTMTGTPLENHLGEYWSVIDLALPGLLGEYDEFRPLIKGEASPALETVINRTRPFVLRRTKDQVLKDLPPKVETDIYLELTEDQKALYQRTVEQVRTTINDAYGTKTDAQAKIIALTAILKLRQICVSPRLVAPAMNGGSPKVEFLVQKVQELRDEGHSALVFSQFTSFLDIVEKGLAGESIPFLRLDGSTPVAARKKLVKEFQSSAGPSLFLLSLKAGGQGLNLTKATYVFHLDPWWNPAVEDQASDRTHRIGQKRQVTITRILMRHTIEEKMMELKARKRQLYEAIMGGTAVARGPAISREDFEFLLAE